MKKEETQQRNISERNHQAKEIMPKAVGDSFGQKDWIIGKIIGTKRRKKDKKCKENGRGACFG